MPSQRVISANVALPIILGRSPVTSGLFTFSFLMVFSWFLLAYADLSFIYFDKDTVITQGRIIEIVNIDIEMNEVPIIAYVFEFSDKAGYLHTADAFSTGYTNDQLGQAVTVEYPMNHPNHARIPSMRAGVVESWVLIFAFLPILGLMMVWSGIRSGLKEYRLLKAGRLTTARLIDKQATMLSMNDQRVYRLTFEFIDSVKQHHTFTIKTEKTQQIEDDENERIIYNPNNPQQVSLIDNLSCQLHIDSLGNISLLNDQLFIRVLVLPIMFITPHVLWAIFSFPNTY